MCDEVHHYIRLFRSRYLRSSLFAVDADEFHSQLGDLHSDHCLCAESHQPKL